MREKIIYILPILVFLIFLLLKFYKPHPLALVNQGTVSWSYYETISAGYDGSIRSVYDDFKSRVDTSVCYRIYSKSISVYGTDADKVNCYFSGDFLIECDRKSGVPRNITLHFYVSPSYNVKWIDSYEYYRCQSYGSYEVTTECRNNNEIWQRVVEVKCSGIYGDCNIYYTRNVIDYSLQRKVTAPPDEYKLVRCISNNGTALFNYTRYWVENCQIKSSTTQIYNFTQQCVQIPQPPAPTTPDILGAIMRLIQQMIDFILSLLK